MKKPKKLELTFENNQILVAAFNYPATETFRYYKYIFELKEPIKIANNSDILEIVTLYDWNAGDLSTASYIDIYDERYDEYYCLEVSVIKGFQKAVFDAEAWNESLSDETLSSRQRL